MNPTRMLALTAALLTLGAAVWVGCGNDDESWQDETIQIGSLFSTTGDGVPFGPQQVKGARLAVEEVNQDDDLNGAELVYTQRDDASEPKTSAREMGALIDDLEVLAVLGPTFSNSAAKADPIANQKRTPVVAVSNTGPGIVGDCEYTCEFVFRDSLGEATAIPANVSSFIDGSPSGMAWVIYPKGDTFGKTSAQTAAESFRAGGYSARVSSIPARGLTGMRHDFKDVVMITASSGETAGSYVSALRDTFKYEGPILGGNAFNSPLVARSLGKTGKGVQSASAWFAGNTSEENQEFIAAYQAKYGEAPDQFAAQAYTGVKLLAEAAGDADLKFNDLAGDREALKASLEKVNEDTPLGEFRFTPEHDVIQPIWIVAMDGKGGYNLVAQINP